MISLERCISVTEPAIHRNLSRTTISVTIAGAWIYALVVACVSHVSGSYLTWYPPFVSTASFFFPLLIIIIAYSLIYKVAHTRERARRSRSLAREIRIAVTLAVVIGAFVVAWLPFFVLLLVTTYCRTCEVNYNIAVPLIKWLHYSGSMVNPFIYTHRNKDFRQAFASILLSCGKKQMNNLSQPSRGGAIVTRNFPSVLKESSVSFVADDNENRVRARTLRSSSYVLAQETEGNVILTLYVKNETLAWKWICIMDSLGRKKIVTSSKRKQGEAWRKKLQLKIYNEIFFAWLFLILNLTSESRKRMWNTVIHVHTLADRHFIGIRFPRL